MLMTNKQRIKIGTEIVQLIEIMENPPAELPHYISDRYYQLKGMGENRAQFNVQIYVKDTRPKQFNEILKMLYEFNRMCESYKTVLIELRLVNEHLGCDIMIRG